MHLERLSIHHFRIIERFECDLPPGRILIVGDNAQGKTTLLEAVFYLVTGRSFRTRDDSEILSWSDPAQPASVRGFVRRAMGDSMRLAITLSDAGKAVRIEDQPIQRLAGLWGKLRAVLFTPDDLQLIKGEPGNRRRYLDVGLSQISTDFLFHLQRYTHVLRQRNALLKRSDLAPDQLRAEIAPWDIQLAEHGVEVLLARFDFIAALQPRASWYYSRIAHTSGDGETASDAEYLSLRYVNFLRTDKPSEKEEAQAAFLRLLHETLETDIRRGRTDVGPHRDDFVIEIAGKPARDYASQGQIRSCVLALRFAEMSEMQSRTGEPALLLLDDLASELDPSRKERVLDLLQPEWQTFLTTTRRSDFPGDSSFATIIHLPLQAAVV